MFSFPDLVDDAVDQAGGGEATAEDVARVRRAIIMLTERWNAKGYNTWRVERIDRFLVANGEADLPRSVDDLLTVLELRTNSSGDEHEIPLDRVSHSQYSYLVDKKTRGRPSQVFLQRSVCPRLYVYPIGEDGQVTLRLWVVTRPKGLDIYDTDADDIPARWLPALTVGVAHQLARRRAIPGQGINESLVARLGAEAREAEEVAMLGDRERVDYTYRIKRNRGR